MVNPTKVGVYRTNVTQLWNSYQYWNGEFWGMYANTVEGALNSKDFRSLESQSPEWKSLNHELEDALKLLKGGPLTLANIKHFKSQDSLISFSISLEEWVSEIILLVEKSMKS